MLVFLYGIFIYSRNKEEHDYHLNLVLEVLIKHHIFVKLFKCEFYISQVQYLGYIILDEGVSVDPKNIKAIMSWPYPIDVIEIRSFMGLAGYYLHFVKDFSSIENVITSIQKKNQTFSGKKKCKKNLWNPKRETHNYSNSCYTISFWGFYSMYWCFFTWLEGVLSQSDRHVTYESHKLKTHEINYAMHDVEMETIVDALKVCRHYLLGWTFDLKSYHQRLRYIFTQNDLNAHQRRWMEFLVEYEFGKSILRIKKIRLWML